MKLLVGEGSGVSHLGFGANFAPLLQVFPGTPVFSSLKED